MSLRRFLTAVIGVSAVVASCASPTAVQAQEVIVEKIPLQYVDARTIALILGGRVLPTELDLWMGRGPGAFGAGANPTAGGGVGPGAGILADPSTNTVLMVPRNQYAGTYGGRRLLGDPRTNSLQYRYRR